MSTFDQEPRPGDTAYDETQEDALRYLEGLYVSGGMQDFTAPLAVTSELPVVQAGELLPGLAVDKE